MDPDPQAESIEDEFDDSAEDAFDVERQLCPDDTCVGLLDADGVCKECGASTDPVPSSGTGERPASEGGGVDLIHRSLCPDGGCIGLLGPDGRCKECGRVGDEVLTDPRLRGLRPDPEEESTEDEEESSDAEFAASKGGSGDFADRQLCPDGSCIGVIGNAGTCKECGTVA
jgi:hypothetical protein